MLQYRTVHKGTLELLKYLMELPELQSFFLVGGTALALRIGHRFSIDLDLFTQDEFSSEEMLQRIREHLSVCETEQSKNTLNLKIEFPENSKNKVKVDLIRYGYPLLKPVSVIDGIRILEIDDIIPMKLSALAARGSKKDFYDIYYLLKTYTLHDMLDLYDKKFRDSNKFHIIKSLTYFEDADRDPDPVTSENINWINIKKAIVTEVASANI